MKGYIKKHLIWLFSFVFTVAACALCFSLVGGNRDANKVYADGTSVTITSGQFFTDSYNASNGWNIQNVENWKTSGKAVSFDYKNNTGAGFASFYFAGYAGENLRVTSQTTVNLSSNTCTGATITDLGDGWYNLFINYADLGIYTAGGANGTETIDRIYFAGIGGNSLSLNNMSIAEDAVFQPATYTTGVNLTSGWYISPVANWATSGYALSMDYKMTSGSNFTISVGNGSQRTRQVSIDTTNHTAMWGTTHYGIVTSLNDGWYRVIFNYKDWGSYNLVADGTVNTISLTDVGGKELMVNNVNTRAAEHTRGLPYALSAGCTFYDTNPSTQNWNIQSVANWKTSGKALYFEYKNVSGVSFYITPQNSSGTQVGRQITITNANVVSFTNDAGGTSNGTVTDLGAGWYSVLINYADLGYVAAGDLAKFYFTGVGQNTIYVNSFNTLADEKFNPVTITTGTTYASGWHIQSVENWSASGYALSFDYKNNTGNTFTAFTFTGYSDSGAITSQIVVNLTYNMVMNGNNSVGKVTELGDGWYRVLVNYSDLPATNASATLTKIYFASIAGNSLSLNNIDFKATVHSEGIAAQLTAGCTYTSGNPTGRRWNFVNVENWKTSGKALSFDYRNGNGTVFSITLKDASGNQCARQIAVTFSNNTVSFTGGTGIVTALGDGWYNVLINYADLGVYTDNGSDGTETIAQMYFTGVGSSIIYVNNINTVETGKFLVSVTGGTGGGAYSAGESCTVVSDAIADGDYFAGWINDSTSALLSYNKSYTFTVTGSISLTASTGTITPDVGAYTVVPGAGNGCNFYFEDCSYLSFDYAITNGEDTSMQLTLDNGDYTNAYGYYKFYKLRANENYAGVTFTDLHNGFMRVEFDIASLDRIQGSGTDAVTHVFVRGGYTDASGYIQNVNIVKKYQFKMVNGALIRVDMRAKGIRFLSTINSYAYDAEATYGMIIIPYDYIETYALSDDYVTELTDAGVPFINLTCYPISDGEGGYYIQGTIADVKDANVNRGFIAFAYSLKGGVYTYAEQNAAANARSFSGLAEAALNDPNSELDSDQIAYLRSKIEAGSDDVSQSMELYGTDVFNSNPNYSFSKGVTEATANGSGYSVKFAGTASASGEHYATFNLNDAYNLTDKYISMDLKFIGAGNTLSIVLYDGASAVCEAYQYDFSAAGEDWVKWVITCNDLTLKAGKTLNSVRYVKFVFDFETDKGFAQTVYMDNIKFTTGSQETTKFIGYSVDPLVQVKKTETGVIDTQANYLQVSAAKGERETAQVILKRKSSTSAKNFTVSVTDLESSNGDIDSSCVTAYMELYHNITARYDTSDWTYSYFDCYPDYTGTTVKDLPRGWLPDALLPMSVAVRAGENKVGSYATQALFFVINVPEDAASGIYHGLINITIEDEGTINMPVQLQVYNFNMPTENSAKFVTLVGTEYIHSVYNDVSTERTTDMYVAASELLADHGVGIKPCGTQYSTGTLDAYITDLKRITDDSRIGSYILAANYIDGIDLTLSGGGNSENLTNLTLYNVEDYTVSTTTITGLKTLFMLMVNESTNECNLFKKAIMYLCDEPTTTREFIQCILADYAVESAKNYVLEHANFTGKLEVREALSNLHNMVTITTAELKCYDDFNGYTISNVTGTYKNYCAIPSTITEGNKGYVVQYSEFWNYSGNNKYTELTAAMNDPDYLVWWYGCIHPVYPYASYLLNAPYTISRVNRWQQFGLGIEGELYYCANRGATEEDGKDPAYLTESQILAGGINVGGGNGDGLLIYPVRDTYGEYGVKWLSSLRLENIAEGNDDYNYLVYAQSLIDGLASGQAAYNTRLNNILATLYTNPMTNTDNPATLRTARADLAALIEELVEL